MQAAAPLSLRAASTGRRVRAPPSPAPACHEEDGKGGPGGACCEQYRRHVTSANSLLVPPVSVQRTRCPRGAEVSAHIRSCWETGSSQKSRGKAIHVSPSVPRAYRALHVPTGSSFNPSQNPMRESVIPVFRCGRQG